MFAATTKQGILVAVTVLITCILGVVTSLSTPVQMIPDLDVRTITVQTGWSGATPQDIEKEILIEQERYLRGLPNLTRMVSRAELGQANIELEFPFGVDVNDALIRVNNALSQVPSYPENVDQPRLFSSSFSSNAFMHFALKPQAGNPLNLDVDLLRDFADDYIRPRMESVPGISEVTVRGGAARQIRIEVDEYKLAQRGVSLSDLRTTIRNRNQDASAGDLETGKSRYLIRVVGRFEELDDIRQLEIKRDGDAVVRIADVAEVTLDHFEIRGLTYFNGERNLMLSVRRESGSNVIDIKTQLLEVIAEIERDLLQYNGLEMALVGDDVQYVQDSLKNVWTNLILGAALATLVMYLFMRSGRATLIGVIGIPICTIAAFLALNLMGRTINVISLAGVAFAIGMTVDNTIVVLESILQAYQKQKSKWQAAVDGVSEVWPAVLASTATTVMVFAPILFVQEEAGQLYSDIAIAISGAIIASMLVAVFVVPVGMVKLTKKRALNNTMAAAEKSPWLALPKWFTANAMRARISALTLLIGIPLLSWLVMPDAEYLPEGEEPKAFSMMIAPPDYNFAEMQKIADGLRDQFNAAVADTSDKYDEADADHGELPPLAYYMMRVGVGQIWVLSAPKDPALINTMMDSITALFKQTENMRAFSSRGSIISSNDGGSRAVAIDLAGPNLNDLYTAANAVYESASEYFDNPQVNSDPGSLTLTQPLVEIHPNWSRLNELGFNQSEFSYAVAALSDGAYVDEFILGDDKIDMFLFSQAGTQQTLSQLANAPMLTPTGEVIPLNALAELKETKDSNNVRRVDGDRTATVYIIPPQDVALETAVNIVRTQMLPALWQSGVIQQGIKVEVSGAADQLQATQTSLMKNFTIALAITYLLLVAIFKHWRYPLFILATIPLGMACGLLGLVSVNGVAGVLSGPDEVLFHQPFDMITMLGFLILLGTVVNNPILIVEQTRINLGKFAKSDSSSSNALANNNAGELVEAIRAAVQTRLRPILMSTATTILGLAPLVFIPGEGTELYRGVGIIVLCGILGSMLLTLTFLPALLYSVLGWRGSRKTQSTVN